VVRQCGHDPLVASHPAQQEGILFELSPDMGVAEHIEEVASAIELAANVVAKLASAESIASPRDPSGPR
jgi:hypothetical protein